MKILFIHQNFPGQYKHLAPKLAELGHRVKALCISEFRHAMPGVDVIRYPVKRGTTPNIHPWASDFETKIIRGEACARAMRALKDKGFEPDIVLAHPGWGEAMFVKDIFPDTKLLSFIEYYYRARGQDVGFDTEFEKRKFEDDARTRGKNANSLLALDLMDWGVSPTRWQRDTNPEVFRGKISVIHDGVDTDALRPDPDAAVQFGDGPVLRAGDEILTFVNRNLEPLRGFHIFMRALPAIQQARPNVQTVIVGGEDKGYGGGSGWKQRLLNEMGDRIDRSRIHFVGRIAYGPFVKLLQVSRAHVYLSYPFVLSWSMIEALSIGCVVIGGDTPPVAEVIADGGNGLLVDFFDVEALAARTIDVLARPEAYAGVRQAARMSAIARYDLTRVCLPAQIKLVEDIARSGRPQPEISGD